MDRWSTFALRAQNKREQRLACQPELASEGKRERRLVRKRGFEPPRSCDRQPLKLVDLLC